MEAGSTSTDNESIFDVTISDDESDSLNFLTPRHFSDVVLVVEGKKFHVHKSTLSRWSPVFETMFTGQFKESSSNEIPLPGKRAKEVEQLLQVIYSDDAKEKVTENNYEFLLEFAREYQMDKVQQYCTRYMERHIDKQNCLHRYKVAEHFELEDIMEDCNEEACSKSSAELEESDHFLDLGFESKFKICMARMKNLEDLLDQFSVISGELVHCYYERMQVPSKFQCPYKASHEYHFPSDGKKDRRRKRFDYSCKFCRSRMVSRYKDVMAPVDALDFDDFLVRLYDLTLL